MHLWNYPTVQISWLFKSFFFPIESGKSSNRDMKVIFLRVPDPNYVFPSLLLVLSHKIIRSKAFNWTWTWWISSLRITFVPNTDIPEAFRCFVGSCTYNMSLLLIWMWLFTCCHLSKAFQVIIQHFQNHSRQKIPMKIILPCNYIHIHRWIKCSTLYYVVLWKSWDMVIKQQQNQQLKWHACKYLRWVRHVTEGDQRIEWVNRAVPIGCPAPAWCVMTPLCFSIPLNYVNIPRLFLSLYTWSPEIIYIIYTSSLF